MDGKLAHSKWQESPSSHRESAANFPYCGRSSSHFWMFFGNDKEKLLQSRDRPPSGFKVWLPGGHSDTVIQEPNRKKENQTLGRNRSFEILSFCRQILGIL